MADSKLLLPSYPLTLLPSAYPLTAHLLYNRRFSRKSPYSIPLPTDSVLYFSHGAREPISTFAQFSNRNVEKYRYYSNPERGATEVATRADLIS